MKRTALLLFLLPLTPALLQAQVSVPLIMSYQGRVTDSAGVGLGTGTPVNRKIIFRLYTASTGTSPIWTEEQTVTIADGEFSVLLGQGIPASGTAASDPRPALDTVFGKLGSDRYLGITVDGGDGVINVSDTELTPRQRLATTAYALRAATVDSIATGTDLQLNGGANYGMGWYGAGRTFSGVTVDGPVLYGAGGGALGVVNGAVQTSVLRWDANGKVGIGTGAANLSTPTSTKLVLQGDETATPAQQLSIRGNADPNKRLNIGYNTNNNFGSIQSWSAASTASSFLINPSGGNVGINTSSPAAQLDVNGSLKAGSFNSTGLLTAAGGISTTALSSSTGLISATGNFNTTGKISTDNELQAVNSVLAGGASGFRFTSGDNDGGLFSPSDGVVLIKTNAVERLNLSTAGATLTGELTTKTSNTTDKRFTLLNLDSLNAYTLNASNVRVTNTLQLNYNGGTVAVGESGGSELTVNGRISATGTGGFSFRTGDGDGGLYSPADGTIIIKSNNEERVRVNPSGRVGIGTSSPQAQLDVQGSVGLTNTTRAGYWNIDPPAVFGGGTNAQLYSIRASNWILAQAYWCLSDERLKEKLGYSDSSADLETMMKLKIADYRFRDKVQNGAREQKKVIAQDVEKVYPQAVTRSPGVIPDILRKVPVQDGWITLAAGLRKGDQVHLIGKDGETSQHEVLEATDERFRTDYKTTEAEVFVYGRQVDDVRTVDYEALAMLNISATQEICRRLQSKSDEVTALNVRLAALEARDKEREDKLALLEKLVLASQGDQAPGKDGGHPRTVALGQQAQSGAGE
ncbi:MAG: tail fiber domain-containing protein [Verrucomicrobiota bacterium]